MSELRDAIKTITDALDDLDSVDDEIDRLEEEAREAKEDVAHYQEAVTLLSDLVSDNHDRHHSGAFRWCSTEICRETQRIQLDYTIQV